MTRKCFGLPSADRSFVWNKKDNRRISFPATGYRVYARRSLDTRSCPPTCVQSRSRGYTIRGGKMASWVNNRKVPSVIIVIIITPISISHALFCSLGPPHRSPRRTAPPRVGRPSGCKLTNLTRKLQLNSQVSRGLRNHPALEQSMPGRHIH